MAAANPRQGATRLQGFESLPVDATNVRCAAAMAPGAMLQRSSSPSNADASKDRVRIEDAFIGELARTQIFGMLELNVPSVPLLTSRLSMPETTVADADALTPVVLRVIVLSDA